MSGSIGNNVFRASGVIAAAAAARTGTVDWVTTPKVTGDSPVTAATGSGYFLNTTAGAITINLPAGAAGSIVSMADYAATWQTNNVTVAANGSEKIGGETEDATLNTEGQSVTFVYVDSTQGWVNTMDSTSNVRGNVPYDVNFLVVAGGGGGGISGGSGGGGAGGYRASFNCEASGGGGSSESAFEALGSTSYTITVGAGGAAHPYSGDQPGNDGNVSSIAGANITTISSAAGGGGGGGGACAVGRAGGSGGGADCGAGGTGTSNQGYAGGTSDHLGNYGGGGGGAGAAGTNATSPTSGPGGAGVASTITGGSVTRGGGGGAAAYNGTAGSGGSGGGGAGAKQSPVVAGAAGSTNTGGGGGGKYSCGTSYAGGSGVVIIRMATSDYSETQSGGTATTSGDDTIITYNGDGSYTG